MFNIHLMNICLNRHLHLFMKNEMEIISLLIEQYDEKHEIDFAEKCKYLQTIQLKKLYSFSY